MGNGIMAPGLHGGEW